MSDLSEDEVQPETFHDIQDDANQALRWLIPLLIAVYSLSISLMTIVLLALYGGLHWSWPSWLSCLVVSVCLGGGLAIFHALKAQETPLDRMIRNLSAESLDDDDHFHSTFQNIVDEVGIAANISNVHTGVIPSSKTNALSLGDRNEAAILITEGALGRLRRDELQAVVAHEMAHVAYGDSRLKFFTTNILNTFTLWDPSLVKLGCKTGVFSLPVLIVAFILSPLLWILHRLLSLGISQHREWRADATAVEYSRDPVALASGLYKLGLEPSEKTPATGFRQYIHFNEAIDSPIYESLLIVTAETLEAGWKPAWWNKMIQTHPPLKDRINHQLDLANVSYSDLESRLNNEPASPQVPVRALRDRTGNRLANQDLLVQIDGEEQALNLVDLITGGFLSDGILVRRKDEDEWFEPSDHPQLKKIQETSQTEAEIGNCPDCEAPLRTQSYLGIPLQACLICGGVALSWRKLIRLDSRHRDGNLPETVESPEQISGFHGGESIEPGTSTGKRCPDCRTKFEAMRYETSDLLIDHCPACQLTWYQEDILTIALNL